MLFRRNRGDSFEDTGSNRVRVALGVRATIFEIPLVVASDEAVRDTDRCAAVSKTVGEFVDGLSFVKTRQTHVVVWTVNSDVFVLVFIESYHELFEIGFATDFAKVGGREVGVHT